MSIACIITITAHSIPPKTRKRVLREKGSACVSCGIHRGMKREDGKAVVITMDHIFPYSKGGCNHFHNLQPMCDKCNVAKADECDDVELIVFDRELVAA
jgi:5-methylcytosine-specific restriction endonuclease McrA